MAITRCSAHVNTRIDPILIETVCIMQPYGSHGRDRLGRFLAKLTNGKPVEYYARHIKNLALFGGTLARKNRSIDHILAICTGVENLILFSGCDFFKNPQVGSNLRRLSTRLQELSIGSTPFYHPCFAKLTHLHLWDDCKDWRTYTGWEALSSLTHLAFASSIFPQQTPPLILRLPVVRYLAIGRYLSDERYKYADSVVDNKPHTRATWGVRVVVFESISTYDWERGARGEGDFWDVVEREVERRLKESVD